MEPMTYAELEAALKWFDTTIAKIKLGLGQRNISHVSRELHEKALQELERWHDEVELDMAYHLTPEDYKKLEESNARIDKSGRDGRGHADGPDGTIQP